MMLSVAVWAGADAAARDMFRWISALIALPTLLYSRRIVFEPAIHALRHGRANMDVPLSIGVTLALGLGLFATPTHGHHADLDASGPLLSFLLTGRTPDRARRAEARSAVEGLASLTPRGATTIEAGGRYVYRPVAELVPGMTISSA